MVGVGPEGSISALARLSAIDFLTGELLVDKLVLPPLTVTSWRTKWSGITAASMKAACDSGDVLEGTAAAREMLSRHMDGETVLIGHALYHDLKVLEIRHEKVVDSASLVEAAVGHSVRTMLGLRKLCKELLGITIQDDGENGHDSVEDALATREVVLWCMEHPKLLQAWGTKRKGELEAKELKAKTKQELVAKRKQELKANEVEARELDAKELSAKRKIELAVARMTELAAKIKVSDAKELKVATQHMQHAARKVAQENERLRTLLARQKVLKAKVDAFRRMCEQTGNSSAKSEAKPTLINQSTMGDQAVLGWQYNLFGNLDMVWLKEPDTSAIEKIVRRELDIPETVSCTVIFLAEGAFNKVHDVQHGPSKHYIMRIAAPVQPQLKTSSEVATIEYVRQNTDVPVPTILKFDSSHDDELGFSGCSRNTSLQRFPSIGNLYMNKDQQFRQGQNVELVFFWENHLEFKVPRGPFSSSQEWLRASLDLQLQAMDHPAEVMSGPYDDSDEEAAQDELRRRTTWIKDLGQRLIELLPEILSADEPQIFTLHHHDLHGNNIFVYANHELSECMPTVPPWVACEIPKFLQTFRNRDVPPDPNWYSTKILGDSSRDASDGGSNDAPDNENEADNVELYYDRLEEHEKPKLRTLFLEEMQRACPEWVEVYQNNKVKAGLVEAVAALGNNWQTWLVDKWITSVEEHEFAPSISDMARAYEQAAMWGKRDRCFDGAMAKAAEEQGIDTYTAENADTSSDGETSDKYELI
ncbi:hypothetical protein G6514_005365 [Epicoccum nigrum]|nr:hypothetical protein G6514_005365 [Epicoccum nigrum]